MYQTRKTNNIFKTLVLMASFAGFLSACAYQVENQPTQDITGAKTIPFSDIQASNFDISLQNAGILDKDAMVLGIGCSANTYKMKISSDLQAALLRLDKNALLTENGDVTVNASASNSTLKCIIDSALSGRCKADVTIIGEIKNKNKRSTPFNIHKTSTSSAMACNKAAKILSIASKEAVYDLVNKISALN